jgi:hypothetical protein
LKRPKLSHPKTLDNSNIAGKNNGQKKLVISSSTALRVKVVLSAIKTKISSV